MKIIANYPATKLKMNSRLAIALKEYDETGSLSEVRLKLVMEGVRQHLNNQKPWSVTQSTSLKDISSRAKVCAVVEHYSKLGRTKSEIITQLATKLSKSKSAINDMIYRSNSRLNSESSDILTQNKNMHLNLLASMEITLEDAIESLWES
jgi:hypothetical protein